MHSRTVIIQVQYCVIAMSEFVFFWPHDITTFTGGNTVARSIIQACNPRIWRPRPHTNMPLIQWGQSAFLNPPVHNDTQGVITNLGLPARPCGVHRYAYIHMPLYETDYRTRTRMKPLRKVLGRIQTARMRQKDVTCMCNAQWVTEDTTKHGANHAVTVYPPCMIPDTAPTTAPRHGVISVGRLVHSKGHAFAGAVCSKLGIPCNVYGGTGTDTAYPNCTIHKNVPQDDLIAATRKAKCVISGANHEDFGIAVVEAIAHGCVPAVPDAYGFRETVPFPELRFPPDDADAAAAIVSDILAGTYDDMVPKLYNHVKQYSSDRFIQQVQKVLGYSTSSPQIQFRT